MNAHEHEMTALEFRREALDCRRLARVYAEREGRVNLKWAAYARYNWHLFKVHMRRAKELHNVVS